MTDLTPELVKSFYADGLHTYGAHVKTKGDAIIMKAAGNFLDLMGILDKDEFLNNFTTVVFDTVYCPYQIGVAGSYSLWDQITTLVHELTHVLQHDADRLGFWLKYLADKSARAHFEAQAYGADLEMHIWRYGKPYDLLARAQLLKHYGLEQEHIEFAHIELQTIADIVQHEPSTVNLVAAWAIGWLEQRAPDLKYGAQKRTP